MGCSRMVGDQKQFEFNVQLALNIYTACLEQILYLVLIDACNHFSNHYITAFTRLKRSPTRIFFALLLCQVKALWGVDVS